MSEEIQLKQADFYTLAKSNSGQRLQLNDPSGKPTKHWLHVRGTDSEVFQRANNQSRRNLIAAVEAKADDPAYRRSPEFEAFAEDEKRRLRASLVIAWSFPEEPTEDAIMEFFRQAPYIAELVDIFASKREQFAGA